MAKYLWTQKQNMGPQPRYGHALAYDARRKRVVLFGGDPIGTPLLNDTWEWDGECWTQVANLGPAPRTEFGLAYDGERQKVVLFGGRNANMQRFGDTWEWDGESWTQVEDSGPAGRCGLALAYDPQRKRVVMFGGSAEAGPQNDTWEWDGQQWTQHDVIGPSARASYSMAYDAARKRVLLFGGWDAETPSGDTWAWDGTAWTQVSDMGPSACFAAAMVSTGTRTALYGGLFFSRVAEQPVQIFGNSWEWDGRRWTLRQNFGPAPRWLHAMALDSDRMCVVLFGGMPVWDPNAGLAVAEKLLGDTWEHKVIPALADPGGGGQPGEQPPAEELLGLTLDPATIDIPVLAPNPAPLQVVCNLQLAPALITRVVILFGDFPQPAFTQVQVPPGINNYSGTLSFNWGGNGGTFQVKATLGEQTLTAPLTINVPNQ